MARNKQESAEITYDNVSVGGTGDIEVIEKVFYRVFKKVKGDNKARNYIG